MGIFSCGQKELWALRRFHIVPYCPVSAHGAFALGIGEAGLN
jgi:hypothetical protein